MPMVGDPDYRRPVRDFLYCLCVILFGYGIWLVGAATVFYLIYTHVEVTVK